MWLTALVLGSILGVSAQPATPRDQYEAYFLGTYARSGECTEPEDLWTFSAREISHGRYVCQINGIAETRGALSISTRACTRNGAAAAPVKYTLDLVSSEVIKVFDGTGNYMLRECSGF